MRKRHEKAEIAAKLDLAGQMAAQGTLHVDIAKNLGISIMTYHRWRKAHGTVVSSVPSLAEVNRNNILNESNLLQRNDELQLENSRLRHIVAELLLEKMKVEERLLGSRAKSFEHNDI
jgi:hypothetical protein